MKHMTVHHREPFKFHNSPVRKKADRQRLPAHDCKECQEFYERLDLPEAQRKELLRKCSRHRAHYAPPPTPENFWELEFPDTQECRERGYLNATQKYVFGSRGLCKDGRRYFIDVVRRTSLPLGFPPRKNSGAVNRRCARGCMERGTEAALRVPDVYSSLSISLLCAD
ncbi:hypothetical protein HPB50_007454 [Hyalomma asiaticum]|uniref:Uncharacterized protein n=1 Tax=Hyalomma asiaticum TaxID=266040 RepID=A0ACB7SNP8_HYAAI|nr:hypothetical protein HPB50_007454 [Hyalomma asiaticum]